MAFSALLSCVTPTTALRIRMVRMTTGSTKAVQSSESSNRARTKEMAADPRRMMTSWSLNCSRTSCHNGVGGSSGNATAR
jgi:hypothetical protein